MRKIIAFISGISFDLFFALPAFAQTIVPVSPPPGSVPASQVGVEKIPQFILNLLFIIGIVASIAFLIFGGIRWVFSRGDKTAVDAARSHIVASIVGLVIVVAAFVIINVVFGLLGVTNPLGGGSFKLPTLTNPNP